MSTPPAPLPASTANWHWKNKNVTKWGHEWFKTELAALKVEGDAAVAEGEVQEAVWISDVFDVDGDIELGQRKSKLITIFDCRFTINWAGTARDGAEIKGRIDIDEVSHENTVDDPEPYSYQFGLTSASSPGAQAIFALAKARLPALMDGVFRKFPATMLDVHGRDLTVNAPTSAEPSRAGTPKPAAASATTTKTESAPKPKAEKKSINTKTVTAEGTFAASADDLFDLLTNEKRIPMWTRAAAQSAAQPDTKFTLFGGGVHGTYISLTKPTEIIQSWALASPTWPSDHFAQLTTSLVQGSDSTKVTFTLSGVPTGKEEEIKRNLEGYYIHGFKSIGYVQLVYSDPSPPPKRPQPPAPAKKPTTLYLPVIAISALILAAAFSIPFLSS